MLPVASAARIRVRRARVMLATLVGRSRLESHDVRGDSIRSRMVRVKSELGGIVCETCARGRNPLREMTTVWPVWPDCSIVVRTSKAVRPLPMTRTLPVLGIVRIF